MLTSPDAGVSLEARMDNKVDFPIPLRPRSATRALRGRESESALKSGRDGRE